MPTFGRMCEATKLRMKAILLTLLGLIADLGALAQGTILFDNSAAAIGGGGAPIVDEDGRTPLSGARFLVQLYAGPQRTSLAPVGVAIPFLTGDQAGIFRDSTPQAVPSVVPGQQADVDIRVWEALVTTYEQAVSTGVKHGDSGVFTVITGNATVSGPMVGMQSFPIGLVPVPEPSVLSLVIICVAVWRLKPWCGMGTR